VATVSTAKTKLRHLAARSLVILSRPFGSGAAKTYGIKRRDICRNDALPFDDRLLIDQWQKEVYQHAQQLMEQHGMRSVVDIGCGSGYKLINYLGQYNTLGLEIGPTLDFVRKKYPDRRWAMSDFDAGDRPEADLVVCADVIEHLSAPDALLAFIKRIGPRYVVISTPSRDHLYPWWHKCQDGPPSNRHHVREWSFGEFRRYISAHFESWDTRLRTSRKRPR